MPTGLRTFVSERLPHVQILSPETFVSASQSDNSYQAHGHVPERLRVVNPNESTRMSVSRKRQDGFTTLAAIKSLSFQGPVDPSSVQSPSRGAID
jgi:hypothetical protein